MKKYMGLFLSLVILLSVSIFPASASVETFDMYIDIVDGEITQVIAPRASAYFSSYSIGLGKLSGGKISIQFTVTGVESSAQLGVSTWIAQKQSGTSWSDVGSWQSGSIGTNTSSHTFSRTIQGTVGTTYRVKCTFTCTNSKGTGTSSYTSSSCTAAQ